MPNKKKSVWEVYLRPNTLTKDNDRDCIADVYQHAETQRNADIADIIVKERTEFRPETIMNILTMRDKVVTQLLEEGLSVMDGVVQITPRVSGVWETEGAEYDEKIHKRTVDIDYFFVRGFAPNPYFFNLAVNCKVHIVPLGEGQRHCSKQFLRPSPKTSPHLFTSLGECPETPELLC